MNKTWRYLILHKIYFYLTLDFLIQSIVFIFGGFDLLMQKNNIRPDHQQSQYSTGSVNQNTDSELDLELKLSL